MHPIVTLTTGVACSFACHANVLLSGIASWQKHKQDVQTLALVGLNEIYFYMVLLKRNSRTWHPSKMLILAILARLSDEFNCQP